VNKIRAQLTVYIDIYDKTGIKLLIVHLL
jgi:hypothetical protein